MEVLNEIWKPIEGYEGLYEVSNLGRVKRLPYSNVGHTKDNMVFERFYKGGILKGSVCRNGYVRVTLTKDCVNRYFHVHRLVARAFIPNPDNLPMINHKDEKRTNNLVFVNDDGTVNFEKSNLEWCTYSYNNQYNNLIERARMTRIKTCGYPIKMLSLSGELIRTFPSIWHAAHELGCSWQTINCAVRKKYKTALGYVWDVC